MTWVKHSWNSFNGIYDMFDFSAFVCWFSSLGRIWVGASMSAASLCRESINMATPFQSSHQLTKRKVKIQNSGGATSSERSLASSVASASSTHWLAKPSRWMSAKKTRFLIFSESTQNDLIATPAIMFGARPARTTKALDDWIWRRRSRKTEFCIRKMRSLDFHPPFGCFTFWIKIKNFPLHARMLASYFHFSTSAAPAIKKQSNYNFPHRADNFEWINEDGEANWRQTNKTSWKQWANVGEF